MFLIENRIEVLAARERKRQGVGCPAFYFSLICCTNITNEFRILRVYDIQDFLLQKILRLVAIINHNRAYLAYKGAQVVLGACQQTA